LLLKTLSHLDDVEDPRRPLSAANDQDQLSEVKRGAEIGWETLQQAEHYTREARVKRLISETIHLLGEQKNRRTRLSFKRVGNPPGASD